MERVERWGMFEAAVEGSAVGNPFTDASVRGIFTHGHRSVAVDGFYDGGGVYRVRFMPDAEGEWSYRIVPSGTEAGEAEGRFTCVPPGAGNHGPVRVSGRTRFRYEDGTPYCPVGTTCYVWNHQGDALETKTLETLSTSPFSKIRMCVFPKHYDFNRNEPEFYPFEGKPLTEWDFTRFDPRYFRHLERRITDLMSIGIEADLILFHPYDRWGFSKMDAAADDRYLRYITARLSAFRNVWWSFANEFDLMDSKREADWDRYFKLVQEQDHVQHLRSVHNCRGFYDHRKPWVTHCSIQHSDLSQVSRWIDEYGKPVVVDECRYEGNIHHGWGNITALEMVNKFWEGFARGGFVGHGETYVHPDDILWWSHGGTLHGESPQRIAFLRGIVEAAPPDGIGRIPVRWDQAGGGTPGRYYLYYTGNSQSANKFYDLPDDVRFHADIIDAWEMTVTRVPGTHSGRVRIDLPGKPYIAVRFTAAG